MLNKTISFKDQNDMIDVLIYLPSRFCLSQITFSNFSIQKNPSKKKLPLGIKQTNVSRLTSRG